MRHLFGPSFQAFSDLRPVVLTYLNLHDDLRTTIQDVLFNVDLSQFSALSEMLLSYWQNSDHNISDAIMFDITENPGDRRTTEWMSEFISEQETVPEIHGNNALDKYVILYHLIRLTLTFIKDYQREAGAILGEQKRALGIAIQ